MMTLRSPWPADTLYVCLEFNHFSAQAIAALNHRYAQKAFVVVRQNADSHKSFVWACSPLAREQNIHTGLPVHILKKQRQIPKILTQNQKIENQVRREIEALLSLYTPNYSVSIHGESLADLSHTPLQRYYSAEEIAEKLKLELKEKIEMQEIAIGIGQTKLMARIMAQLALPDMTRICDPGEEDQVLTFLDCRFLPGLSPVCREKLKKYGLKKVGQVNNISRFNLFKRFGREGEKLFVMCQGMEGNRGIRKSRQIMAETILKRDINNNAALARYLRHTIEKFCFQLQIRKRMIKKITVQIRYTDHKVAQKTTSFASRTNSFSDISERTAGIFKELYTRRVAIRSIRVLAKEPLEDNGQLSLFDSISARKGTKNRQGISNVRQKISFNAIRSAADLNIFSNKKANKIPMTIKSNTPSANESDRLKVPPNLHKRGIFFTAGDFSIKSRKHYLKYFSFSEIQSTFYYRPQLHDFYHIEQSSRGIMIYAVVAHKSLSQPADINVGHGIREMEHHIQAVGPLLETGRFYSLILQLSEDEIRSQKMLAYLIEVAAVARQKRVDVHVEFRHISWQSDFVLRVLADNGIGICNTELPGDDLRMPLTSYATSEKGYIRYHGCGSRANSRPNTGRSKRDYQYSEEEIEKRLPGQIAVYKKVSQLAIAYNNRPLLNAARNAIHNISLLDTYLKKISP